MKQQFESGFQLIYCEKKLMEVIHFLEIGFNWNSDKSSKIFQHLSAQSPEFPKAAVYIEKSKIKIAILLFHQGQSTNQKKDTINMSAWLATRSHRGIEAITFVKRLIDELDKYVITNFTPTNAVYKILKTFGFSDMRVQKKSIFISKKFPFLESSLTTNNFSLRTFIKQPVYLNNVSKDSAEVDWYYNFQKVKMFGLNFRFLNLYSKKDKGNLSFFWVLKMVVRFQIVRINIYRKAQEECSKNVWLIKNSDKEFFVLPVCSELVI